MQVCTCIPNGYCRSSAGTLTGGQYGSKGRGVEPWDKSVARPVRANGNGRGLPLHLSLRHDPFQLISGTPWQSRDKFCLCQGPRARTGSRYRLQRRPNCPKQSGRPGTPAGRIRDFKFALVVRTALAGSLPTPSGDGMDQQTYHPSPLLFCSSVLQAANAQVLGPQPLGLRTSLALSVGMALTKRVLYPAENIIAEWADLAAIAGWAKAKPEDIKGLAAALGEEELDMEPLAALPDEILIDAVAGWVETVKPGHITQVKVGMAINAARLQFGAELIDPIPKKRAMTPKSAVAPGDAGTIGMPASQPQQLPQQQTEQQQQQSQQSPFVPRAVHGVSGGSLRGECW